MNTEEGVFIKISSIVIFFIGILTYTYSSHAAEYNSHEIFAGIGVHSEKYDCPEVCYGGDDLAIVEYTYKFNSYSAFKALHISNYRIEERGMGTNAVFVGAYIQW